MVGAPNAGLYPSADMHIFNFLVELAGYIYYKYVLKLP